MTRPIRIGVQLWPGGTPSYQSWRAAVRHAEDIGTDLIFGYDHFHAPSFSEVAGGMPVLHEIQPDVKNFEGWTALATWGEITHRAEIGLLVSGIGYRNPDLLADMARTVDHISSGRLILGIGAGWYEKDYTTYAYDFGTVKSRFDLFDQGLERIQKRLNVLLPPPVRKIPILIGGSGAKRTIPAVARYADLWHTFLPLDQFQKASTTVDELAAQVGRKGSDIERSVNWDGAASADAYRDAGATTFTTEIHPTSDGYDFTVLNAMLAWRDSQQ
jgi:probable F420-dependent oxidoreductase